MDMDRLSGSSRGCQGAEVHERSRRSHPDVESLAGTGSGGQGRRGAVRRSSWVLPRVALEGVGGLGPQGVHREFIPRGQSRGPGALTVCGGRQSVRGTDGWVQKRSRVHSSVGPAGDCRVAGSQPGFPRCGTIRRTVTAAALQGLENGSLIVAGHLLGVRFEGQQGGDRDFHCEISDSANCASSHLVVEVPPGRDYCDARKYVWSLG